MKLLFDQNISYRVLKKLALAFGDSIHVSQLQITDKTDYNIWLHAKQNNYHIVTFDADFFDLSNIYGHPPKIIWLRIGNTTTQAIADLLNLKQYILIDFINSTDYSEQSCIEID